ncbi:MAG: hypothetical protein V4581_13375 [Bacteroidota bacterium]
MKKMYFLAMLVFTVITVQAQAVTQKNLEGTWRFISYSDGNQVYDLEKREVKLTEKGKKDWDAQHIAEYEEWLKQAWLNSEDMHFNDAIMTFKGDRVSSFVDGEKMMDGDFGINKEATGITVIHEDGVTEELALTIKDNLLYMNMSGLDLVLKRKY